jgi:hypothetical protein
MFRALLLLLSRQRHCILRGHAPNIPNAVGAVPPEYKQVMLETCTDP